MSWMQFLSQLVANCAWPIVAGMVFWQLKKPLISLINALDEVGWGPLKANRRKPEILETESTKNILPETEWVLQRLLGALSMSPHSFAHLRDRMHIDMSDDQFRELVTRFPDFFRLVTIKGGRPGIALIRK